MLAPSSRRARASCCPPATIDSRIWQARLLPAAVDVVGFVLWHDGDFAPGQLLASSPPTCPGVVADERHDAASLDTDPMEGRSLMPDPGTRSGRDHYTLGHERSTLASHGARTAANSAAFLLPHLKPGMTLLDVGCGPGTITLDLAEMLAPGKVTGVEYIDAPLVAARKAAAERGDASTRFQIGDAQALPFPDDTFDVVFAHQVLQHLMDPIAALREMHRVCRPGGCIAARDADYGAMAWYPELPELDLWRLTYCAAARANGAEPDAGRRLRSWAAEAELPSVELSASVWNYADPKTCAWWGNGQADRYGGETFATQAAEQGLSRQDVARIADGWRRWGQDPGAWFVIIHGELLARLPE